MSADPPKTVPSSGGKVPLVSEVLERLVAELGGEASRRPAFFQAALQVCSEELRSVKGGGRAAPLEELVARARKLLGTPAVRPGAAAAATPAPAAPPAPVRSAAPARGAPPAAPSLPFPDDEPTKEHVLPGADAPRQKPAVAEDDLFTIDEPSEPTVATARPAGHPPAATPAAAAPEPALAAPRPAPTGTPPFPVGSGATVPGASAAAPVPPPRREPPTQPLPIAAPAVRDLFGSFGSDSEPPLETPTGDELGEPFVPTRFEPYGHDAQSPRSRRALLRVALGGTGLVAIVVAALWLFGGTLREAVLPTAESSAPTPAATPRYQSVFEPETGTAGGAVEASRTAPTAVVQPTRPPAATPQPTAAPITSEPARNTRPATVPALAAVMVSPDWANRPPAYAIHFASYQDHARAERDAAQTGTAFGRPAVAAEVDLGSRGRWHRVMLVGFAGYGEARAFHDRLRAQGTPGLGGVYYLVGPE